MRKLNLEDFTFKKDSTATYEYRLMVGNNEFRFRLIGEEPYVLASVIYSVWGVYNDAKSKMDYTFLWVKDRETAVRLLNEFISKMISDWKTFYKIMDKYEIHYK